MKRWSSDCTSPNCSSASWDTDFVRWYYQFRPLFRWRLTVPRTSGDSQLLILLSTIASSSICFGIEYSQYDSENKTSITIYLHNSLDIRMTQHIHHSRDLPCAIWTILVVNSPCWMVVPKKSTTSRNIQQQFLFAPKPNATKVSSTI